VVGKTISHYKILDKLGEGGMGVVYKARDTKLDRMVAIKFLPQHLTTDSVEKERFVHEAKAASALNHTNVTTIYEIDEFKGQTFIVMEYCEGETLRQVIQKETLSIRKVLNIAVQICEGLAIAHEKGIVHRDIKSDNIMLTPRGQVKIMDFGLAKLKGATRLTQSRSTLGTASYMSPEQAQREEVDHRSDIFSFGVVLYELLTGQLPFQGDHEAAVLHAIINEEPLPVARFNNKVSEDLQRVVSKALAKEKEERYQHIDDVLADLRREKKSLEYVKTTSIPPEAIPSKSKKKLLPFLVPASIVLVLVLLFLILKPFQVDIAPKKEAVAEQNRLAIMYFENLADPDDQRKLGEIAANLLITDLSESQYLDVVSSQRLYDILKLLGKEGEKRIDREVATEVARKAGGRWMLLGSILQIEPQMIITCQLVDVESGSAIASQRITGDADDDIFALVDKLTVEIKNDLSLPAAAQAEPDRPVVDVTTHSPEAYRYYLEGVDYFYKLYFAEAVKSFEKALEYDSTFAMVYYWLSVTKRDPERKLIAKAVEYSDKASWKEKRYIEARAAMLSGDYAQAIRELQKMVERYPQEKEAFAWLGIVYWGFLLEPQKAVPLLTKAIEIDPLFKIAYNVLAYAYKDIGDFEKSIWAINEYISLAPDEANPYDSRGEIYAFNGKLEQAIESFIEAEKRKRGFSLNDLGHMYLFKGEYAMAESCYKALASSSDKIDRSEGRFCLALVPLYQGRLDDAMRVLDAGINADMMEEAEVWHKEKHFVKAVIYREKKNLNLALEETQRAMEISREVNPRIPASHWEYYVRLLTENNEIAKAQEEADAFKGEIEDKSPTLMYLYWYALGFIKWSKGNTQEALAQFEKLAQTATDFFAHFTLAEAYLESDRLGEAVAEFEEVLSRYDSNRAICAYRAVKAHYLLGLAYEKSGWNKKAIEQYEEFLEIWKDADPGIPEVGDAKQRLKALKAQS
jgi:tetratricopeptide (TPR) repeat protein/tRNA A-37 threonylcarbamoyl transferase component Bud32